MGLVTSSTALGSTRIIVETIRPPENREYRYLHVAEPRKLSLNLFPCEDLGTDCTRRSRRSNGWNLVLGRSYFVEVHVRMH